MMTNSLTFFYKRNPGLSCPLYRREYGLHTMDLPRLNGEVADVRVLKRRSSLLVALVKGGRGGYSKNAPWVKLQAAPAKSSDS